MLLIPFNFIYIYIFLFKSRLLVLINTLIQKVLNKLSIINGFSAIVAPWRILDTAAGRRFESVTIASSVTPRTLESYGELRLT